MKTYESVKETKVRQNLTGITCDRCGGNVPEPGRFEIRKFTLEFNEGTSCYDDAYGDVWEVEDLCNECVTFLQELLLQNGFRISKYNY